MTGIKDGFVILADVMKLSPIGDTIGSKETRRGIGREVL
jgi:hypothetical protein